MSNTIYQPSPRYQTEFNVNSWHADDTSSQPFFSPLPTTQYSDPSRRWDRPPDLSGAGSFKDSGYASSPTRSKIEGQSIPPMLLETPESSQSSTLLGYEEDEVVGGKPQRYAAQFDRRPSLYVPPQIPSPELVHPVPGEEYLTMRPPTPPASNTSMKSYIRRFKAFTSFIKSLKWMEKERCTADYYPGQSAHTARHLQHRPMVVWHARDYYGGSSAAYFDDSSVDEDSLQFAQQPAPGQVSQLNLLDEFSDEYEYEQGHPPSERFVDQVPYPRRPVSAQVDLTREFSEARPRRRTTGPRYPGGYVPYADLPVRNR